MSAKVKDKSIETVEAESRKIREKYKRQKQQEVTTFMFTNETLKPLSMNIVLQAPNKQLLKNLDISKTGM